MTRLMRSAGLLIVSAASAMVLVKAVRHVAVSDDGQVGPHRGLVSLQRLGPAWRIASALVVEFC